MTRKSKPKTPAEWLERQFDNTWLVRGHVNRDEWSHNFGQFVDRYYVAGYGANRMIQIKDDDVIAGRVEDMYATLEWEIAAR